MYSVVEIHYGGGHVVVYYHAMCVWMCVWTSIVEIEYHACDGVCVVRYLKPFLPKGEKKLHVFIHRLTHMYI